MEPSSTRRIVAFFCCFLNVAYLQDVSEPSGVICSQSGLNCVAEYDYNVIMSVNAKDETECQLVCSDPSINCLAYTWYDGEDFGNSTCYLLKDCSASRGSSHYHSGPKKCHCEQPNHPQNGHWECRHTEEMGQGPWTYQWTDCNLGCSDGSATHTDCDPENHQWNPAPEESSCQALASCHDVNPPYVQHGRWECYDDEDKCKLHCDQGYYTEYRDFLNCQWWTCCHDIWCAYNYDEDNDGIWLECNCGDSCKWYEGPQHDYLFKCLGIGCNPTFPDGSSYSSESWSCMDDTNIAITPSDSLLSSGTRCKRRCAQGEDSVGYYTCQGEKWEYHGDEPTCQPDQDEVLYFFTTQQIYGKYPNKTENPPGSNIINDGIFTCHSSGLHLFTLNVKPTGNILTFQLNDEEPIQIPVDEEKSNSFTIALNLNFNDLVKINGFADLDFAGLSLYDKKRKSDSKYLRGIGIKDFDLQNADQPMIFNKVDLELVDYSNQTGAIQIPPTAAGIYMTALNLASENPSYASLDINGIKTLGLGEDRNGLNLMSNFILKEFKANDTIQLTVEALSKITNMPSTQLSMISVFPQTKDASFCAYSSDYNEFETLTPVKFENMFLPNINFDNYNYTHPSEDFDPRRYYLLSATAFIGGLNGYPARLAIEQLHQDTNEFIELGAATTRSPKRTMLQVTVLADMDRNKNKVRVTATGFMDEGPQVHFATFCGFRLGL